MEKQVYSMQGWSFFTGREDEVASFSYHDSDTNTHYRIFVDPVAPVFMHLKFVGSVGAVITASYEFAHLTDAVQGVYDHIYHGEVTNQVQRWS